MTRLVVLCILFVGLVFALSLANFQSGPVNNRSFDLKALKKHHHDEMLAMEKAKKMAGEGEKKVVKKVTSSLIPLTTDALKRGHEIYYKRGKCSTCHGKKGEGKKSQQAPKLAGQHDWYLREQLALMKNKERPNAKMAPYLKKLNEQDFADVADYLSKLPPQ